MLQLHNKELCLYKLQSIQPYMNMKMILGKKWIENHILKWICIHKVNRTETDHIKSKPV